MKAVATTTRKTADADRGLPSRMWYALCRYMLRVYCVIFFQLRHSGYQNVPASGPMLIVSNHQSHLDPSMVGCGVRRQLYFLARQTLFDAPLFGWLIRSVNAIPVDREGNALAGIKQSIRVLRRGEGLMIFPEGTRSPDGQLQAFRPGLAALAKKSGATIVPVALEGAFQAWPRRARWPRFRPVHVHYGRPIWPEELDRYSDAELLAEVHARVQECLDVLRRHPVFAGSPVRVRPPAVGHACGDVPLAPEARPFR